MKKHLYLPFLLYFLLIVGFLNNVDPNGGALKDFQYHYKLTLSFSENLSATFFEYDKFSTRHSPVLYIFLSFLYKIGFEEIFIRLIFFHICLILPLIFYKCLKIKFSNIKDHNLIIFSLLILLSPSYWSLSIWPDDRILGLVFFTLSILNFLKFIEENKLKYVYLCIINYTIATYLSPNFSIFSVFYFYHFCLKYKFSENIFKIILLNIILAFPALFYLFSLDEIFLFQSAVPSNEINASDYYNVSNKILIIISIIFFHLLPFLFSKSLNINWFNYKNYLISFTLLLLLSYFFNYQFEFTGGGIFYKVSFYLTKNNFIFFGICFLAIYFIIEITKNNKFNFLLILLLIISNPQYTIYHKYYDPLILIIFPLLFQTNLIEERLFKNKTILIFYFFTSSFLILNFLK